MAHLSVLIKPASSLCNLRCRYCFYADVSAKRAIPSFGIMEQETTEALIQNVYRDLHRGDEVSFLFQGGEPTLAGLPYFKHFTEYVSLQTPGITVHYGLQTNGILLNEEWCRFLKSHNFLIGLSLDGAAETHDRNRIDPQGKGTWKTVMHAKRLLEQAGVEYNILWVLTEETARRPEKAWNFLRSQKIRYVQFIPCLEELDSAARPPWALSPQRFVSFYIGLFRFWSRAFLQGEYISVKFFDDVFNLLVHQEVTACGFTGKCQVQYVIEADGSVYPCDFYVLDSWRLGNIKNARPSALKKSSCAAEFLSRARPDEELCENCPYKNFCNGGCPRMYACLRDGQAGFCGYREFLTHCRQDIERIAALLIR